jgi:hypothetical protein
MPGLGGSAPGLLQCRPSRRRGVLLLVVLGLLVVIGTVAIAFVILTSQAARTSSAAAKIDQQYDPPEDALNQAALQLIRGSSNLASALGPHSLLEDLYGDSILGSVGTTTLGPGGQFINVVPAVVITNPGIYVGSVFTLTSGPAAGTSMRIVGYRTATGFQLLYENGSLNPSDVVHAGDSFVVNYQPFSGTGFGLPTTLNPTTLDAKGTAPLNTLPLALLPNDPLNRQPAGRANEDYDAPDYQNMHMALVVNMGTVAAPNYVTLSPSFHRPELANYWTQQGHNLADTDATNATNAALRRATILRPMPADHPLFTGSNPTFNPLWTYTTANPTPPWDVDNDGDGVPDSVWIDLGMPARAMADGKMVKPLFAILCRDLDGRINLNAHGNAAQAQGLFLTTIPAGPYAGSATPVAPTIPFGLGFGPADVSLASMFGSEFQSLLFGNTALEGRYGELALGSRQAGTTDTISLLGAIKHFEYPALFNPAPANASAFGTPPDLWGRYALGLDWQGQPLYQFVDVSGMASSTELNNNPYRLNLSRHVANAGGGGTTSATDNPFTPGELERVLRPYDVDAQQLANRLVYLAPTLLSNANRRHDVTTESSHIPTAPRTPNVLGPNASDVTIRELLRRRLANAGVTAANLDDEIRKLLAWDLIGNLKMDVNRPVGSGGTGYTGELDAAWGAAFGANVNFLFDNGVDINGDGNVNAADRLMGRQLLARHLYVLVMLLWDAGYVEPHSAEGDLSDAQMQLLLTRRIAQWAVNVVDFRDADSVMTPFEFDYYPFAKNPASEASTWNVDGVLGTADDTASWRGLVWGCERPELVLTETLAFHDRRVADTNWASATDKKRTDPSPNTDATLDQTRVPQGSAFFELYCTRSQADTVAPTDLYTANSGVWKLDLGKLAPAGNDGWTANLRYPVWRMVISNSTLPAGSTTRRNNVAARMGLAAVPTGLRPRPTSSSLEPNQYRGQTDTGVFNLLPSGSLPGTSAENVDIDRIVWFGNLQPNGHRDSDRIFWGRAGSTLLPAGQYAVVGPRRFTAIGSASAGSPPSEDEPWGAPIQSRSISLLPSVKVNNSAVADIQPPLGLVVAADPPSIWNVKSHTDVGIGINISEPLPSGAYYYPEPRQPNAKLTVASGETIDDAYGDLAQKKENYFLPSPLESNSPSAKTTPLKEQGIITTGTYKNIRTVFLQRLANPNQAYNYITNPYITVDWSPMDLTVFNGEDRRPAGQGNGWDPDDANSNADDANTVFFGSRQRGASASTSLWSPVTTEPAVTASDDTQTGINFRHPLTGTTLGYVNTTYGSPWSGGGIAAYKGMPAIGDPPMVTTPVPFLQGMMWNNRPYASEMELLMVPSSSPARLLFECNPLTAQAQAYDKAAATTARAFGRPFGPLLNPFMSNNNTVGAVDAPNFFRVLDYLRVPSRFIGTETVLNPGSTFFGNATNAETQLFRPPFNMVSTYREPGRVNINTIASESVWTSLLGNNGVGPAFNDLQQSRRGYAPKSGEDANWGINDGYPTRFANPFRSAAGNEWTPTLASGSLKKTRPVNATLLRAAGVDPDTQNTTPLFAGPTGTYRDAANNPYFYFQGLERLGNLVTTQSNVYAAWITVGYFEVTPWTGGIDSAHPDGLQLGQEAGADTGDVKRHRAFYIIDRSVPVGFQRGRDLNVEKTFLLKRYIE